MPYIYINGDWAKLFFFLDFITFIYRQYKNISRPFLDHQVIEDIVTISNYS